MSNDFQDANEFVKIWKDNESGLFHIDIKFNERVIVSVNGKEYHKRSKLSSLRGEQETIIIRAIEQDRGNPIDRRVPSISRSGSPTK